MPLDGYEKAAIFLSTVGEETAAEILKDLDINEIGKITTYMSKKKSVSGTVISDVMKEAANTLSRGDVHLGGRDFVRKVLYRGLGEDGASKILEIAAKESPLDSLKRVDPKILSNFLVNEHPQTIALVICLLEAAQAAEILSSLPDELKDDIAIRIAKTERISESAIAEIGEALKGELNIGQSNEKKLEGVKTVAGILNHCDKTTEQMLLGKIEDQDATLADSIRQLMFIFDDLVKVDDRGLQAIMKEISTDDLSLALKSTSNALKEKIFKNMSQRAARILKEDMQTKGPAKVSDVEKAQQNIVKIARKLEAEGRIILAGMAGEALVE